MNILQMTLAFPPCFAWGGPVKTTYQSCKELVKRGHFVTIYCANLLDKNTKIYSKTTIKEIDGIKIVYFNAWNIKKWPGTLGPVWLPDLNHFLKNDLAKFDIVHINGYRNIMHLPLLRATLQSGIPLVIQPHGTLPVIVNSFLIKRLYDYLIGHRELEGISALIALQQSEVEQATSHGVPLDRIHIIPNGLDSTEKKYLPKKGLFREKYNIPMQSKNYSVRCANQPKKRYGYVSGSIRANEQKYKCFFGYCRPG